MEPLAKTMPGISPMAITVAACLVGVASGAAAAGQQDGLSLGLWGANRLLDGLDGDWHAYLARALHRWNERPAHLLSHLCLCIPQPA